MIDQVPQISDHFLTRPLGGTHALDQRPVGVSLAVLGSVTAPQVHAGNLPRLDRRLGLHYIDFRELQTRWRKAIHDFQTKKKRFSAKVADF